MLSDLKDNFTNILLSSHCRFNEGSRFTTDFPLKNIVIFQSGYKFTLKGFKLNHIIIWDKISTKNCYFEDIL